MVELQNLSLDLAVPSLYELVSLLTLVLHLHNRGINFISFLVVGTGQNRQPKATIGSRGCQMHHILVSLDPTAGRHAAL